MPTPLLHAGLFQHFNAADSVPVEAISLVCGEPLPDPAVDAETIDGTSPERRLPGTLTAVAGAAASGGGALLVAGTLLAGGFVGATVSRGLEPDVADVVDQALNEGAILVVVEEDEANPRNEVIHATMREHGATLYPAAAS